MPLVDPDGAAVPRSQADIWRAEHPRGHASAAKNVEFMTWVICGVARLASAWFDDLGLQRGIMTTMASSENDYVRLNPDWHEEDAAWKARQLLPIIGTPPPATICDVGCGVGAVLAELHDRFPEVTLVGYEVGSTPHSRAQRRATDRLSFRLGDAAEDPETFELMLILDVIEHVPDPMAFLARLRFKASRTLIHIPLDLSVQSVLRPSKLLAQRRKIGHIHYFTPETALATVTDAGYCIDSFTYTTPFWGLPPRSRKAAAARMVRKALPRGVTVRLLGGYSLLVSATPRTDTIPG